MHARHLQLIEYGKVASDIAHFWRMVTGMFLLNGKLILDFYAAKL